MMPMAEIIMPQLASTVPAFLAKLWKMVDDPDTDNLITWGDTGDSFVIMHQAAFSENLLPYYYKHSNLASFVRQLNMYGFNKRTGVDTGGLKSEKDQELEYSHPYFRRGQEILLGHIKRKVANVKIGASGGAAVTNAQFVVPSMKNERVTEVLNEVTILKDKQEDMDSKLDSMKKENETLWREVITLRQKHSNQQKIVNKLIHFLMSYLQTRMQPSGGNAVKRRYQQPLAIESRGPKEPRFDTSTAASAASSAASGLPTSSSNLDGPIIFDVTNTDDFILENVNSDPNELSGNQANPIMESPKVETPMSPLSKAMHAVDPSLVNPAISVTNKNNSNNAANQNLTLEINNPSPRNSLVSTTTNTTQPNLSSPGGARPTLQREISKEDFDLETMMMQKDIDNLKDMLSGQITLDSSLISNLFNPNEPLFNLNFPGENLTSNDAQQLSIQLENPDKLISTTDEDQQPSLFELADIEESNEALMMPPPPASGGANASMPSLETPLISVDDTLDLNPLVAQITSRKGRKKLS